MPDNTPGWDGRERRGSGLFEIENLHRRLSEQDAILMETRDLIRDHVTADKDIAPAIRELVGLWRASKLLGSFAAIVAGAVASVWAVVVWAKDHVRI